MSFEPFILGIDPRMPLVLTSGFGKGELARPQVELDFGGRAENSRTAVIEFTLPPSDDDGGEAIPDQIHARSTHIHELVDAEDDGDADGAEAGGEKVVQGG
jgi:hypothetical protein